jgi:hypothetical protein
LIATATDENLTFTEDETNQDANFTERNAIRVSIAQKSQYPLLSRPRNPFKSPSFEMQGQKLRAPDVIREYTALRDDVDHAGSSLLQLIIN